ncbi:MAG: peptide deformylase [Microgenomates group bacterium]
MSHKEATLLQIAQLGQSVLRKKSSVVFSIKNSSIQALIKNLTATLMDVNGVGIAAPQVYQAIQLFIIASHPNPRYPNAPNMKPTAVINPSILSYSKEIVTDWEGCLSVPGIRALVPRSKTIAVEYITKEGKKVKKTYRDFLARIFQHEFDHLQGIVFLDRVKTTQDIITEKEFQRLVKIKKRK